MLDLWIDIIQTFLMQLFLL